MSGQQRHREPIDVHLILRRDGEAGAEVLLSRRAGDVYASGHWHLVSGHLDGPHKDVVGALIREASEEAGVCIDAAEVRFAVAVHHRGPGGRSRTGMFFEVLTWQGTPGVREPEVCDAMGWFPLEALPNPMVAYCRAGLDTYRSGQMMAVHFQEPTDPIAYDAALDRRRPVPAVGTSGPDTRLREFTEQAVGHIAAWTDVSWSRESSRVWRAHGAEGGAWFVKVHQNDRFHQREVRAYRTWASSLGRAVPRLVAADEGLRAVVLTAVPGRPLVFRRIGALARRIHESAPSRNAPVGSGPAVVKADRHLAAARPHLVSGDEAFVRELVRRVADLPPLEWVETHGDFQLLH
ncbi:NUDIX domain-containing protein [Streptomyces sp. NBC_00683]|uniref:NUDIX domain-containing protein n=1 Tax=Streptomyces sp. NBC_00683 TaxID=2903670 RepID=UPI002E3654FC|nr:NUDIX domain-containing protein [Streptomyces sp. NBC_00683]